LGLTSRAPAEASGTKPTTYTAISTTIGTAFNFGIGFCIAQLLFAISSAPFMHSSDNTCATGSWLLLLLTPLGMLRPRFVANHQPHDRFGNLWDDPDRDVETSRL
jgi:hypothetical protein